MARLLSPICGVVLAISAVGYICYDGWAWEHAAKVVDSGFRRLALPTPNERPGGIYLENDSYYWLSYATRMGEGESWRIRYTLADNAPYGRPVHWSQSISWLLVTFGKLRQSVTGETWPSALEQASVWVSPFLLMILTCAVGWALFRRVGAIPAGLFMVYLVSAGDVGWAFQPLRPGHQTLYSLFGVMTLVGLAIGGAGWIRNRNDRGGSSKPLFLIRALEVPELPDATRWFLVSGACAALGLWISAVVSTMLLGLLFAAGLFLVCCAPALPEGSDVQVKPELWRWWGWVAGGGSFLLCLVEYFPNHLSLFRLEVNGPLYSLSVAAMGEGLCQFLRARHAPPGHRAGALIKGLICAAIVAVLPAAIVLGPQSWHALRDPEMFRLHNFIQEFYSFPRFAGPRLSSIIIEDFGILPLFVILAIGLAGFSNLRLQEWAVMWLSFAVTLGMLGFAYLQVRWLGLFAIMNAWLAVITGLCAWRLLNERLPDRLRPTIATLITVLLVVQPVLFAQRRICQVQDIIQQRSVLKELTDPVLNKRLALALRAAEGSGARVMADLDLAPALHYFAGASAVASFYWENLDGLHAATRFFADADDGKAARAVALQRGLTHIIVQEGNRLQNYFYFIATGRIDEQAAKKLFVARLMSSDLMLPNWLHTTPALQNIGSQIYTYGGVRFEERWRIYNVSPGPESPGSDPNRGPSSYDSARHRSQQNTVENGIKAAR